MKSLLQREQSVWQLLSCPTLYAKERPGSCPLLEAESLPACNAQGLHPYAAARG